MRKYTRKTKCKSSALKSGKGKPNISSDIENNNVQRTDYQVTSNLRKANSHSQTPSSIENFAAKMEISEHEPDNIDTVEHMSDCSSPLNISGSTDAEINTIINVIERSRVPVKASVENTEISNEVSSSKKSKLADPILAKSLSREKRKKVTYRRKISKKIEGIEKYEKLFIRLVKFDIPKTLNELKEDANQPELVEVINAPKEIQVNKPLKVKVELIPKVNKPTKKVSKSEVQQKNLQNVNKTESLKMEQVLLEKFKKVKEKLATNESANELEEPAIEIEQFVYEKTSKPLYETFESTTDENGQMILRCLLCPFTGERCRQMTLHYKFKHKETPIEEMHFCNIKGCKFEAVHEGIFKWHMRRHMLAADKLVTDLYPCAKCDKVFDQRKGFLIHLKHMHKDPALSKKKNDYPCATCNFRTNSQENLDAHIYKCHVPSTNKAMYKCNICGIQRKSKVTFNKHLTQVHLNISPID